jgi:hypothetical protein
MTLRSQFQRLSLVKNMQNGSLLMEQTHVTSKLHIFLNFLPLTGIKFYSKLGLSAIIVKVPCTDRALTDKLLTITHVLSADCVFSRAAASRTLRDM